MEVLICVQDKSSHKPGGCGDEAPKDFLVKQGGEGSKVKLQKMSLSPLSHTHAHRKALIPCSLRTDSCLKLPITNVPRFPDCTYCSAPFSIPDQK